MVYYYNESRVSPSVRLSVCRNFSTIRLLWTIGLKIDPKLWIKWSQISWRWAFIHKNNASIFSPITELWRANMNYYKHMLLFSAPIYVINSKVDTGKTIFTHYFWFLPNFYWCIWSQLIIIDRLVEQVWMAGVTYFNLRWRCKNVFIENASFSLRLRSVISLGEVETPSFSLRSRSVISLGEVETPSFFFVIIFIRMHINDYQCYEQVVTYIMK